VVKVAGHDRAHRGPGARVRRARRRVRRRAGRRRSSRATSSSSATRGRAAARACARCSASPPRSSDRRSTDHLGMLVAPRRCGDAKHRVRLPGRRHLPAYDAMLRLSGPDPPRAPSRHEQGATHMADGYARASGKVGVAIATSGPGATNMVTGIATAMMDSSPIVCITGQVGSKLIGSDAFQETDITGITLPITKHNYLVTRADIAPAIREAFYIAALGAAGPGARRHHEGRAAGVLRVRLGRRAPVRCAGYRPDLAVTSPRARARARPDRDGRAAGDPRRPGRDAGGATDELSSSPSAPTSRWHDAARHRRLPRPPAQPRHDGHARRGVGEHAIQEADLLLAFGMRFDDRVTGNSEDLRAEREEDPRRHRPGRDQQERPVDVGIVGDLREVLRAAAAVGGRRPHGRGSPTSTR
jgi:acetolactate synthase I/II/III large subunit